MAKKIFIYRGKTLEELQALSMKELAEIYPSRQRRKIERGLSPEHKKLLAKIEQKDSAKTHRRDMLVFPSMVGKTVSIHNGKTFVPITITEDMISLYFGELVLTRNHVKHNSPGVGATKSSAALSVR